MINNTKLLVIACSLIFFTGFGFLWFGLQPVPLSTAPNQSPLPVVATNSAFLGAQGERAQVTKVVDGDTIIVDIGGKSETVRFVGMDTPETVDPRRPVGCFGKEASNETKSLLSGKVVILQKDVSNTDKYKRLLRYIYLPMEDGRELFVNDYLIREGFARVLTYPPDVKYNEQFREAERQAKEQKRGLWEKCLRV